MRVILSAAVTADGYLDDNTPQRLMISTAADWRAVQLLRASCDAILIGAETLRRDNPTLQLHDDEARRRYRTRGRNSGPAKVILTRSGALDPAMRLFTEDTAEKILFAPKDLPEFHGYATVISSEGEAITAAFVITELEKRGIGRLLVEGGASILGMFLREGAADEVRLAVNPQLRLGSDRGGARFRFDPPETASCRREKLDGMEVATYVLHPDTTTADLERLQEAIDESRRCTPCRSSYRVGAVIETCDGECFKGYTHESSATHHAEQEAIRKALEAGASLRGATIYSSMEPCSKRASEPESCTQLILRHGFARVVFALYEPDRFVCCRGALTLREAGLDVRCYPELGAQVREINAHLWE